MIQATDQLPPIRSHKPKLTEKQVKGQPLKELVGNAHPTGIKRLTN